MAKVLLLLCGIIVFQAGHEAAPSKNSHPVISISEEKDVTLDSEPPPSETHQAKANDASQSQRQKRFYDYLDYLPYNFPSAIPYPSQPHNSKRDGSQQTGVYGTEDALSIIFKRLHEIFRDVRYQNVPYPAHTPIPAYIPFLFVPQFNCGCGTNNQGTAPPTNNITPQPTNTDAPPKDVTATTSSNPNVTLDNRVGLDDKVQNWGIVTSKPILNDVDDDSDGSRPISFDPIPPEEPLNIPVPPVDHGTVQAGEGSAKIPNQITSSPPGRRPPSALYQPSRPVVTQNLPPSSSENFAPSLCDGAIISCCNKPLITDKCFELQGCENPTIYGSPCDPKVQLMVIAKFQNFHKRRSG